MKTSWIPDWRIDWPNHVVGFFSALFGILIAFQLDEWREQKKERDLAMMAYEKLRLEIESNQAALHSSTESNLNLLNTLQENLMPFIGEHLEFMGSSDMVDSINSTGRNLIFIEQIQLSGGGKAYAAHIVLGQLDQPVQHFSAWESAKATGALNYMKYERVQGAFINL